MPQYKFDSVRGLKVGQGGPDLAPSMKAHASSPRRSDDLPCGTMAMKPWPRLFAWPVRERRG